MLERERSDLQSQISFLTQEIENSRIAFDRYRERARESLLKTATDQQAAEAVIAALKEQIKVILIHFSERYFKTLSLYLHDRSTKLNRKMWKAYFSMRDNRKRYVSIKSEPIWKRKEIVFKI